MTDNGNISRRRFVQATGGAASAIALAGCTGSPDETATPTESDETETETDEGGPTQSDKTYRLVTSSISTFDPVAATDTASGSVIQNLFDCLTNYKDGSASSSMQLAEDFESSPGGQQLTFHIRSDATFSNGDQVTAHDFVYSFERLAASENSKRASFILDDLGVAHSTDGDGEYAPGSLAIAAEDDSTFQIELESPFHASLEMLAYTSFAVVPEGLVDDVPGYDGEMDQNTFGRDEPVGAGPYTLANWEKNTQVEIEARPIDEYHGEGPFTSGTHWQIIEDTQAAYTYATLNVNADHPSVPNAEYDESLVSIEGTDDEGRKFGSYGPLENGLEVDYYQTPELSSFYWAFNCETVPKFVRQAFAYAHNMQEVIDALYNGPVKNAFHFTPPDIFPGGGSAYDEHAQEYPYGVGESMMDEARELMEAEGYDEDNRWEMELAGYTGDFTANWMGMIRDRMAAAHIDLEINQVPWSAYLDKVSKGDTEAYILGWIADYPAPDNFLKLLNPPQTDTSKSDNISGFNWSEETGDAAGDAIDAWQKFKNNPRAIESDQEARNEAYITIEEANWEDAVMVTTHHRIAEHMKYQWVDKPRVGAMGTSRQAHNEVEIGEREDGN